MGFELRIAAQRAPGTQFAANPPRASFVSLIVNGPFDHQSYLTIMHTAKTLFSEGADSVFIELEQVSVGDLSCIEHLAADVMNERAANRHVQVIVRDRDLHAACSGLAHSRDWLIAYTNADVVGGRRALHVDSKSELQRMHDATASDGSA